MRIMIVLFGMFLVTTVWGSTPAWAQEVSPLAMSYRNLSLTGDSTRLLAGRKEAQANDTLQYVLTFTNREARALTSVVLDNPLPHGLTLIGGTVTSSVRSTVEYSIDKGRTYSAQPMVEAVEAGRRVQRPAPVSSYTHIRWLLLDSVAPGARATATFDMRVGAGAAPTTVGHTR